MKYIYGKGFKRLQDKVLGTSLSSVENFSLEGVSSIKIKNMIFYTGIIALMICYVINAFGLFGAFFFG